MFLIHLDIPMNNSFGREIAAGVQQYRAAESRDDWVLTFESWGEPLPPDARRGVGVILRAGESRDWQRYTDAGIPSVNISGQVRATSIPSVLVDNAAVGRLAAHHFLERGFRHFGVAIRPAAHLRDRAAAFVREVRRAGHRCAIFALGIDVGWREVEHLRHWLRDLPRPLGMFAVTDLIGRNVCEACRVIGVPVPEQVAVVGVDNDELACQLTQVPLSSIDIDARRIGFTAASVLADLLKGRRASPSTVRVPPRGVVVRRSTDILAIEDADLARALRYIRDHACDPIGVADVLDAAAMSRRALEVGMKARLGRTPGAEIRRVQIDRAKSLLAQTDLAMPQIAHACGFVDQAALSATFRRHSGSTPSAYRRQYRAAQRHT